MASHASRSPFRRAAGVLAALALAGAGEASAAGPPTACRVPDSYLSLSAGLDHTETLISRREPVRIVVLASSAVSQEPLEAALQRRLPGAEVQVDAILSAGLAHQDAQSLRTIVERLEPDLVVWQVGVRDALAASDVTDFGATLDRASAWVEKAGSDLLLVDPPFVPRVQHERIYAPYVGEIAEAARAGKVAVLRRYALMRYLSEEAPRIQPPADQRPCTLDLMAEAISRSVR